MKWLDMVQRKQAQSRLHANRTAAAANRSSDNEAAAAAVSMSRSDRGNACIKWRKRPSPMDAMLSGLLKQLSWWSPECIKVYHRVRSNAVIAITKMRFRSGKTSGCVGMHPLEPPPSLSPRSSHSEGSTRTLNSKPGLSQCCWAPEDFQTAAQKQSSPGKGVCPTEAASRVVVVSSCRKIEVRHSNSSTWPSPGM
jgi:hypothetical protein